MSSVLHPTAGYILNVAQGAQPGLLPAAERDKLRALAARVREIARHPKQAEKRELWHRHNQLEPVRPMVLVFPEDSWQEIIRHDHLELSDPFWRQQEWYLKHLIYRDRNLADDFVVEPELFVSRVIQGTGWGLSPAYTRPDQAMGAWTYEPPLKELEDIEKLTQPTTWVDEEATRQAYQALGDVFGDLLAVRMYCQLPHADVVGTAAALRGIERLMWDMYDNPEWLHRLMDFISKGQIRHVDYLEQNGYLTLNNGHHYNDSGGIGYTSELPSPEFDGHVRLRDLWGYGCAQELALVGPAQHEEFVLNYQLRLLDRCGLNAYGCCESYASKFDMLKRRVPRLRRVSVSPWCDIEVAAAALEDKYIYSWKPNPAMIVGDFDPEDIRAYIRRTLEITRGCVVEMIHKDTTSIEQEPAKLETWSRIAREEIDRISG